MRDQRLTRAVGVMVAVAVALLGPVGGAVAQGVIELRDSAAVAGDRPVVLSDVAVLHGDEASVLAPVVVRLAGDGGEEITIAEVRRAIEHGAAGAGVERVNWGRLSLRGNVCRLVAAAPAAAGSVVPTEATPAPVDPRGTVRELVMLRIAAVAQAPVVDLRLAFAPEDDEILNLLAAGRTVEVTPTGLSDRLPLAVRVFEGERLAARRTIRVGVEVRREVVISGASLRRGETIAEADVTRGVQWLGLSARPARMDQVVGTSPRSRLTAGQVVMADDVAPMTVVNKGEQVTVYCISGTVVLTMRARAAASARDGEMVLLEALDSKRSFYARMDGRGRAVVQAGK